MKDLSVGQEKIAYRQIGNVRSSDTYVFIHGSTMTGEAMLPLARHFIDNNCIIIDLPGHGGSDGAARTTVEEFSECIDLFLQQMLKQNLISDHITLIGYSLGGTIAYDLALKKRMEYKRMVILSSGANVSECAPILNELRNIPPEKINMADVFSYLFGSNTTGEERKAVTELLLRAKVEDSVAMTDLLCATYYNKIERANEISIPTFIFAGDEDKIITTNCEMDLWKHLKNASIAIVPFRGHTALFEEMELLVRLMKDFCRKNQ